jgi:hypothetical protein
MRLNLRSLLALSVMLVCASSTLYAQTLMWDPNRETDIAGYKVYQGTQTGVYGTPIDVGNTTTYQPQGIDWTKRAYFAVQAYNTSGLSSPLSAEAVWTPSSVTTFTSLTASSAYPVVTGTPVTWTATASNNLGAVEYKFWMYKKASWVMVQDYSSSNTYQWLPTLADAGGPYYVQAWARAVGSTAAYEVFGGTPSFNVVSAPLTLTANVDFPTPPANQVTWTAILGSQGSAPVEYRFLVTNVNTNTTTVLRDYSSSNQAQWTPLAAGRYTVQVMERRVGSTNQFDLTTTSPAFDVMASTLSISSFSTTTTFPAPTGTPIKWVTRVKGGMTGPIQYAFWLFSSKNGWRNVQPYGATETFTWTPTWADEDDYALQVWVKNNGSTAAYDVYAGTNMFHIQRASLHLTTPTLFPVAVGTPVTWTGDVPDPSVTMEYQFWQYSYGTSTWTLGQAYGAQKTFVWTPTVVDTYSVQVWARQVGSTAAYDMYMSVPAPVGVVSAPAQMVSLTSDASLPATAGTTITWTAGATGGTAPLEYQFWRQDGSTWTMVQNYGPQNTYKWITASSDIGAHAIQVRVRSQGSTAAFEAQMTSGTFNIQ